MELDKLVVLITTPNMEVGRQIGGALVEQKLAACVNFVSPVGSLYAWQGKINDDEEVLLVVKTRAAVFEALEAAVKKLHPYEVPEIIGLPIVVGSQDYLDWIAGEVP